MDIGKVKEKNELNQSEWVIFLDGRAMYCCDESRFRVAGNDDKVGMILILRK